MWSWVATLAVGLIVPVAVYIYFSSQKPVVVKNKSKGKKDVKSSVEKTPAKSSKSTGKKSKAEVSTPANSEAKAKDVKVEAPKTKETAVPASKSKKSKSKAAAETSVKEVAPVQKEVPEVAEPIVEPVETEPTENGEAKNKKKKKKKPAKKEEVPASIEEPTPEPEKESFQEDSSFTKPTNNYKADRRNVAGVSERKPVESSNPWALLGEVNE